MNRFLLSCLIFLIAQSFGFTQGFTKQTFHDAEKRQLKEVYQVKDTVNNIIHGRYISYYLNGSIESKGQFTDNETTGTWEFYYETGKLKMRGILFKGANYGLWEYFFEGGKKSMEGIIYGRNREGEWKSYYENGQVKEVGEYKNNKRIGIWKYYFEDGALKGAIEYSDDFGRYTEYYHSGKVLAEGPKTGTKNSGHWRYFAEDGTLQSEGDFANGKKQGMWTYYFPSGKISSSGKYENDELVGSWVYYYENGNVSASGDYLEGKKNGNWKTFNANGSIKSEASYENGSGDYREYFPNGKLKVKGQLAGGKRQGKWEFYYGDGKQEAICEYINDKGIYYGYYPNGNLQTKGTLEGELKTGTWEIYENDGTLSGYYRPFYDNRNLGKEITKISSRRVATVSSPKKKRSYWDARSNEFKGVILSTNPLWTAVGRLPLAIEFYLQERLGHEFEFTGIRDPFFKPDLEISTGKQFQRGYSICIKQKFYNPLKAGLWYFGHEFRFTNLGHYVNQPFNKNNPETVFTFSAAEQRIQYGGLLGFRLMRGNNTRGFTIDSFISGNIGYRSFDVDAKQESYFDDLKQSRICASFNFGLNFGNVFPFR